MALRATSLHPRTRPSFSMSLRGAGQPPRDVAIRVPAEMPGKLAAVRANSHTPTKSVIANQCAHWRGNPFSPQRSLASQLLFGQIRTHLPSLSLRTSAHTGVAIRIPAEEPGKSVVLRANSSCFSYLPKVFLFVLWYCKEYGLPRRSAPRNDMQKLAACQRLQQRGAGQIRTHLPSLSLRTSAHTGVAIRIPAEEPGKSVVLRANSSCFSYLPKVFLFVLWYCKEYGLPRRSAPRNDMQKLAACQRLQQRGAGQIRTHLPSLSLRASAHTGVAIRVPAEEPGKLAAVRANSYALSRIRPKYCFSFRAAAGDADCHVASLLAMTVGEVLAPAHTSFLLHVIASQCAHWRGNPFSPQRSLASWLLFGQIRRAFRIRPKYCFSFRAAAGERIATSLRSSQ